MCSVTDTPNHALQRTRHGAVVCNRGIPRAGSLSLVVRWHGTPHFHRHEHPMDLHRSRSDLFAAGSSEVSLRDGLQKDVRFHSQHSRSS